jgi:DNA helicase-2/ATP-dependent DNA helicase PcrA
LRSNANRRNRQNDEEDYNQDDRNRGDRNQGDRQGRPYYIRGRGRLDEGDDYNQDIYAERETGRTFGSGTPKGPSKAPQGRGSLGNSPSPYTRPPAHPTQKNTANVTPSQSSSQKTPTPPPAQPKEQQYKPGDRVRHDIFGEGIILKSEMERGTEFVEVQFQGKHGKKRLSTDFAKLEKL